MHMQFQADWSEFNSFFTKHRCILSQSSAHHTMVPGTTFQVYAIIPALGAIMAILWPKTPVLADEENPWTQDQSLSRTVLGEDISQHHHLNQPMMIQNLSSFRVQVCRHDRFLMCFCLCHCEVFLLDVPVTVFGYWECAKVAPKELPQVAICGLQ